MSRTRRKFKYMKSLRHPKTQSEKRKVADATDQGVRVRAKRTPKRLPDDYDDEVVSAIYEKVEKSS